MKDKTSIMIIIMIGDNTYKTEHYDIHYKDFSDYRDLPDAAKCDEVKKEFDKYWASITGKEAAPKYKNMTLMVDGREIDL